MPSASPRDTYRYGMSVYHMCENGLGDAASDHFVTTQGECWKTPRPKTSVAIASVTRSGFHQLLPVLACLPSGPETMGLADDANGSASVGATTSSVVRTGCGKRTP